MHSQQNIKLIKIIYSIEVSQGACGEGRGIQDGKDYFL
jgi:hypothetical protein